MQASRPTLLPPEYDVWTATAAAESLADATNRLAAALRLVELSNIDSLCCSGPLTDDRLRRLAILPLDDDSFVIGFTAPGASNVLRAPVLVGVAGSAVALATGAEEEAAEIHRSPDPELFPHLVVLPHRVSMLTPQPEPAIQLKSRGPLRFVVETVDGLPLLLLKARGTTEWQEAARYPWDPYELLFTGPARDKLENVPNLAEFELDVPASKRLLPRGGLIPEPPKPPEPEPGPPTPPILEGVPT